MGQYNSSPDIAAEIRRMASEIRTLQGRQHTMASWHYAEALGEVSTTATTPTLLSGGPSINIEVATNAFVAVFFECQLHGVSNQADTTTSVVSLFEDTDLDPAVGMVARSTALGPGVPQAYVRLRTDGASGTESTFGSFLAFPAAEGQRTYEARYNVGDNGTATFRNRKMWIQQL